MFDGLLVFAQGRFGLITGVDTHKPVTVYAEKKVNILFQLTFKCDTPGFKKAHLLQNPLNTWTLFESLDAFKHKFAPHLCEFK